MQLGFNSARHHQLVFSLDEWTRPVNPTKPELLRIQQAEALRSGDEDCIARGVVGDAYHAVAELLPEGDASLPKVARTLGLHARTLQRRLSQEGVSFAELVTQVRRARAEHLLGRRLLPISEVSQQLGYSEPSAFNRAFRRWTGLTPSSFRQEAEGQTVQP